MSENTYTLNSQEDIDTFWQKEVAARLEEQRMLLLFVANDIPDELEPVVKFLDGQMQHIDVLAVAVKQHAGTSDTDPTLETGAIEPAKFSADRDTARNQCLCGCGKVPRSVDSIVVPGHDRRLDATLGRVGRGEFRDDDCDLRFVAYRCLQNLNLFAGSKDRRFHGTYSPEAIIKLALVQAKRRQRI